MSRPQAVEEVEEKEEEAREFKLIDHFRRSDCLTLSSVYLFLSRLAHSNIYTPSLVESITCMIHHDVDTLRARSTQNYSFFSKERCVLKKTIAIAFFTASAAWKMRERRRECVR